MAPHAGGTGFGGFKELLKELNISENKLIEVGDKWIFNFN